MLSLMNMPLPLPATLSAYMRLFVRRYKWFFMGLSCIALASALFRIQVDYELQHIIDTVASNPKAPMIALLIYFVVHKTMHHVVHFLQKLLSIFYKPLILQDVTETVYAQIMRHSLCWFDDHLSGEISSKINDFQDSLLGLLNGLFYVASHIFLVLLSLIFLSTINGHATLVLLVFILVYTPLIGFFLKRQMDIEQQCASVRQEAFGMINDSISNVFGIKTMGRVSWEFSFKLIPALKKWRYYEAKSRKYHAYYVDLTDTFLVVAMGIVQITLIAYLYRKGLLTPGQFAFVAIVTLQVHRELAELIEKIVFLCNPKIAALKASYAFMTLLKHEKETERQKKLPNIRGKIAYKNFSFAHAGSKTVLKNITVSIAAGEKIGIVGASGAGKTTFIKCLLHYFPIESGAIFLDDHDIANVTQESLCQQIALIPQDIPLFHRSILENLRLVNPDASLDEIQAACKKASIHSDIMTMPHQYQSILGERGMKLSGGQRQRLAIARIMLKKAPIIILDEATSALDTPTERLIQSALNAMITETHATTLMIAHRLSTVMGMDRILVFDQGRIVQDGTHSHLITEQDGLYKILWDAQTKELNSL